MTMPDSAPIEANDSAAETTASGSSEQPAEGQSAPEAPAPARRQRRPAPTAAAPETAASTESGSSEQESAPEAPATESGEQLRLGGDDGAGLLILDAHLGDRRAGDGE